MTNPREQTLRERLAEGGEFSGHGTLPNGTHVPLTHDQAKAIWEEIEQNEARKAKAMPTTAEAVRHMFDAFDRLRKLGWRGGVYCPKDGTPFAAICHGSTGIFTGSYEGDWPSGRAVIEDSFTHPDGFVWKPMDELTDWEREQVEKSREDSEDHRERMFKVFDAMDGDSHD